MIGRRLALGFALAAALAVLGGALVWITRTTLQLERDQAEAQRLASQEEKVRLALWRLDSALTAFVGRENARPAEPFPKESRSDDVHGRFERSRFEVSAGGPARAASGDGEVPVETLLAALAEAPVLPLSPELPPAPRPPLPVEPKQIAKSEPDPRETQALLNSNEFLQRSNLSQLNQMSQISQQIDTSVPPGVPPAQAGPVRQQVETTFQPIWVGEDLYLVRRVRRGGEVRLQGVRIDWPEMRGWMLDQVRDLLPRGDLLPASLPATADPGRRLALLPVRLEPGLLATPAPSTWTPTRLTLAAASGAIVLVVAAFAALLFGSLQQSRRRADFVSAVTHELRTPLTTFRMYADMLADGMVPPGQQGEYLDTLRVEAGRLGHLVENVLAYARLERQPRPVEPEPVDLEALLREMAGRLGELAARGGFEVVLHPAGDAAGACVLADRGAVERILLNWVDNACKYAAEAADRRLEIQPLRQGSSVLLRLSDHGPGIPRPERRRIFRPFHKSAHRAAVSAPGVGLGLALSRGLARRLGGDLRLVETAGEGAVFELRLPAR
jgi:signal transduction histidine kinase